MSSKPALSVRAHRFGIAVAFGLLLSPAAVPAQDEELPSPRTQFDIEPGTPVAALLPAAPKRKPTKPRTSDELRHVPEIDFQEPLAPYTTPKERSRVVESLALTRSRIEHLNKKDPDAFVTALLKRRRDLAGLPVMFGADCRLETAQAERFQTALATLRSSFTPRPNPFSATAPELVGGANPTSLARLFWRQYREAISIEDSEHAKGGEPPDARAAAARVAVLMQVFGPESEPMRVGLARHLAGVFHVDATKALAKLAVFSEEESVRLAAIDGLKQRRGRDYDDVLLHALRYPYPPVARRGADALIRLEREDWAPKLVALLEEPDPRAPRESESASAKQPVVRELVRINHHRNCFLCHPPVQADVTTCTAPAPIPGDPLPSLAYYANNSGEILVRFDVTYLRQDFSFMQRVVDHGSWPEMQRYDFVVRQRTLTQAEADALRHSLTDREPAVLSPYHRAALAALRGVTGRDAAPTAAAWRELLGLKR